jgi:hypothetical protein
MNPVKDYHFELPKDQGEDEFQTYCQLFIDPSACTRDLEHILKEYIDLARETERMCELIYG